MNSSFLLTQIGSTRLLAYRPWWERSILHGMTLAESNFSDNRFESAVRMLLSSVEADEIIIPKQTHGADVVVVDSEGEWSRRVKEGQLLRTDSADAVVAIPSSSRSYAIGVRTADCVPILIEGVTSKGVSIWGVVHAGWRGLACSVIEAACSKIEERGGITQAAVFACGGGGVYEVGEEVIQAIGDSAVYSRKNDGKALLDLGGTAAQQLGKFLPSERIGVAEMCTITAEEYGAEGSKPELFHSFRRDGERSGRSLTFVVPKG